MNFGGIQQSIRPRSESGWQLLVPIVTVLISGLVVILAISPQYLRELNPVTLLLLFIACALPIWAWNQRYLAGTSPAMLYGGIIGLSVLVWMIGLFALHRSCRRIDVEPLRELWHELKNKDELLETINSHAVRIEKLLVALCRQDDAGPEKAMADKEGSEVDESHSRVPPTR